MLICKTTFAWDATAHRLIAQIAWDHSRPTTRARVNQLIRLYNPRYDMVNAAIWADWIRYHDVAAFDSWHFLNCDIKQTINQCQVEKPQHIVWAINQAIQVLSSQKADDRDKALFLRFLIHLVADAHQPLHTVSLYNAKFPQGDAGGNFYTLHFQRYKNLHSLWDGGIKSFDPSVRRYPLKRKQLRLLATKITEQFPQRRLSAAVNQLEPQVWVKENLSLANNHIYKVSYRGVPTKPYRQASQQIVYEQCTLAGYRLARILNNIFKTT